MKQYKYALSYIIPYKHSPDRLLALKAIVAWLNGFNAIEIIVVEQDNCPKINYMDLGCKYHFIQNDETPFNKSWSLNVGLKYATSDIIAFGDSDLMVHPNYLIKSISLLSDDAETDMISPYNRDSVIDLKLSEMNLPFDDMENINRVGRGKAKGDIRKVPLCGGVNIFKRQAIEKLGGWDEEFIGWGGEDDFQSFKVEKMLRYREMDNRAYHIPHKLSKIDEVFYKRNLEVLSKLKNLSDKQLGEYIKRTCGKVGALNKYS